MENSDTKLIIYSLITHKPATDFSDNFVFKPELQWLHFIGLILLGETYFFWLSALVFLTFCQEKKLWK